MRRADAAVVLSSTWRYDPIGILGAKHWGIPVLDATPDLPDQPRREEIRAWLAAHPTVKRFAVIDDEDDELDDLPLFQPSQAIRLTDEMADVVVAYLRGETDRDTRRGLAERIFQNLSARLRNHPG